MPSSTTIACEYLEQYANGLRAMVKSVKRNSFLKLNYNSSPALIKGYGSEGHLKSQGHKVRKKLSCSHQYLSVFYVKL